MRNREGRPAIAASNPPRSAANSESRPTREGLVLAGLAPFTGSDPSASSRSPKKAVSIVPLICFTGVGTVATIVALFPTPVQQRRIPSWRRDEAVVESKASLGAAPGAQAGRQAPVRQ